MFRELALIFGILYPWSKTPQIPSDRFFKDIIGKIIYLCTDVLTAISTIQNVRLYYILAIPLQMTTQRGSKDVPMFLELPKEKNSYDCL